MTTLKKKIWLLSSSTILAIAPIAVVVSCSNSKPSSTDTQNIQNALQNNEIKVNVKANKDNFKITDFSKDTNFSFSVDSAIKDEANSSDYYNELVDSLSKSKINFIDYYIPKYKDDQNSFLLFKVNDDDSLIPVQVSNVLLDEQPIIDRLSDLTQDEIKTTIKNKLNSYGSYTTNLILKLRTYLSYMYQEFTVEEEEKPTFINWWNSNISESNRFLKNEMIDWYTNTFIFFGSASKVDKYQNFIMSDITISEADKPNQINVSFFISTSSLDEYPEAKLEISQTFFINF